MNLQRVGLKTRFQWIKQRAQWIKNSKKAKKNKLYAKKSFLGKVRGEWFLNIFLLDLDTISVLLATIFSLQISRSPNPWRISHIIYAHFADPSPPFVYYASHYSSACPIRRLSQSSVSCSNQDSTVQGSSPHKYGQRVQ